MSLESDFSEWVLPQLKDQRDEASRFVLDEVARGGRLGDVVIDAIESLPTRKTVRLREIVSLFEAWQEWQSFERRGWEVDAPYGGVRRSWARGATERGARVGLRAPQGWRENVDPWPSEDAVAVAVGALRVELIGAGEDPDRLEDIYEVIKV